MFGFWATVCKIVRPMLSDRCLYVCPVCDVGLLFTIERICNQCTGCVAMVTLWKCMAEPSSNLPGPPHAARSATQYACRRRLPRRQ